MKLAFDIISAFILTFWFVVLMTSPMMLGAPGAVNDKTNIITIIVVLCYPIYLLVLYWLLDISLFGVPAQKVLLIASIIVLAALLVFGYIGLLINSLRGIATAGYSVTASSAYYNAKAIEQAEPESFAVLASSDVFNYRAEYARDKQYVFYCGEILTGADPESFQPFESSQTGFWQDQTHIYYGGEVLPGAKPTGFKILEEHTEYSVYEDATSSQVYHYGKLIASADAQSLTVFNYYLSKDKQAIYYGTEQILPQADVASFEMLPNEDRYARDKHAVYDMAGKDSAAIVDADPASIQVLQRGYIKDQQHVYYRDGIASHKVLDADANSFVVTAYDEASQSEAKDKHHYYWQGKQR